ncbi:hypothetical protein H5410_023440 [Solanum commersonii]|uniref:Uncharacterized protein n=1 Tax=Solanum commersonii TaxID=4109 RepID=A0A9J5ZJ11_SOLCO|nr:hypothetical protein H5410_023440 [Solanum commersonii]
MSSHSPSSTSSSESPPNKKRCCKDELSNTLVFYYPLAGRIIEGPNRKLMVNCNSEGIMFIEAEANVELEKLGDSIISPCPYLEELLYNEPGSDGIIGCPLMISVLPVWQRDLLSARSLPCITCTHNQFDESKNAWIAMEDKLIQHSFFFGNKEIEVIQDQLLEPGRYGSIGRFELLVAFLWKYRTIALNIHSKETVHLSYVVNVPGFDEVDFGWGKPILGGVATSTANSFASFFVTFNNKGGEKGIVVAINLPPQAMEKFQDIVHNIFSKKNIETIQLKSKI